MIEGFLKIRDLELSPEKTRRTDVVIDKLNTIILGWANHHKHIVSRKVFRDLDHAFWQIHGCGPGEGIQSSPLKADSAEPVVR